MHEHEELLNAAMNRFVFGFGFGKHRWSESIGQIFVNLKLKCVSFAPGGGGEEFDIVDPVELVHDSAPAAAPALTLIGGAYGTGKTTVLRRIATSRPNGRIVLPITLGWLRPPFRNDMRISFADLVETYFHSGKSIEDRPRKLKALRIAIQKGEVVFALDGLDELTDDLTGFNRFFQSLGEYLRPADGSNARFNVIVSARSELLDALGVNRFEELHESIARSVGRGGPRTNFLAIDKFEDTEIQKYLSQVGLGYMSPLIRHVRIRTYLSRPLHLALFCHLLKQETPLQAWTGQNRYTDLDAPVKLIRAFIESYPEMEIEEDIDPKPPLRVYTWDFNSLAKHAALLHKKRIQEWLDGNKLRDCIRPADEGDERVGSKDIENDRDFIIHKCPFVFLTTVDRPGEPQAREKRLEFSHRIFYEYFVTKGVFDELDDPTHDPANDFYTFDNLVLTVDMRRFLRDLVTEAHDSDKSKPDWKARTRHSYALSAGHRGEWSGFTGSRQEDFEKLDAVRYSLLEVMTAPDQFEPDDCDAKIDEFLRVAAAHASDQQPLHPRYAMYCLEACAVYLNSHRRRLDQLGLEGKNRIKEIEYYVGRYLEAAQVQFRRVRSDKARTVAGSQMLLANLLLFERCLDISRRIHLQRLERFIGAKIRDDISQLAEENQDIGETKDTIAEIRDTIGRIHLLLESINDFPE